jgi:hypothetical protein
MPYCYNLWPRSLIVLNLAIATSYAMQLFKDLTTQTFRNVLSLTYLDADL